MKTANFNDTVDILVKAYLNDTLEHGVCSACAVGNICLAAGAPYSYGYKIQPDDNSAWKWVFHTQNESNKNHKQVFGLDILLLSLSYYLSFVDSFNLPVL